MRDPDEQLPTHRLKDPFRLRWLVFAILGLQYLTVYFHRVAPAVVAPDLVKTYLLSGTSLGILASAYFYAYGLAQLPVGILCDSWGARKTVTLFSLITTVGVILFGVAPSFTVAAIARFLIGLGVAAVFVGAMKTFAAWFKPHEYGRISSALMAIGGIGWFSATTPLGFAAAHVGWRASFIVTGFIAGALTIVTWFWVKDEPPESRPAAGEPARSGEENRHVLKDLAMAVKERHFWAIAIWFIMRGGVLFGFFGLWAGPYLTDIYGLSKGASGVVLSMIAFAMMFGSPAMGHLSDRTLESRKKVLVGTSALNLLCFVFMIIFFDNLSLAGLCILFFVMGVTVSSIGTLAIASTKEYFPARMAGTVMGAMNIFPFIGAILFQPLIGLLLDAAGAVKGSYPPWAYRLVIIAFAATSVVALISILFCKETMKNTEPGGGS